MSHFNVSEIPSKSRDSVHKSQYYHEEKVEPKRGVEPASSRFPAERLTTRPSRLTVLSFRSSLRVYDTVRTFKLWVQETVSPEVVGAGDRVVCKLVSV